ncbi:MAG TPA: hypothetical protein VI197_14540 [Polyangiaceae bacterium]
MTTLICLTIATPIALLVVALVPALWLQSFVVRGFPSRREPPCSPAAGPRLPRPVLRTVG